jgi:hypothetical protein
LVYIFSEKFSNFSPMGFSTYFCFGCKESFSQGDEEMSRCEQCDIHYCGGCSWNLANLYAFANPNKPKIDKINSEFSACIVPQVCRACKFKKDRKERKQKIYSLQSKSRMTVEENPPVKALVALLLDELSAYKKEFGKLFK